MLGNLDAEGSEALCDLMRAYWISGGQTFTFMCLLVDHGRVRC